jgi:hypothetical protein
LSVNKMLLKSSISTSFNAGRFRLKQNGHE